jgi:hypothetical protein
MKCHLCVGTYCDCKYFYLISTKNFSRSHLGGNKLLFNATSRGSFNSVTMTTQIRETQLGLLVRFLSSNKLLQYPDEVDSSAWKQFLQRNTTSLSTPSGKLVGSSEKLKDHANPTNPSANSVDTQNADVLHPNLGQAMQDGKDIYLVDWYGPNDTEVSPPILPYVNHFSRKLEPPKLAQ